MSDDLTVESHTYEITSNALENYIEKQKQVGADSLNHYANLHILEGNIAIPALQGFFRLLNQEQSDLSTLRGTRVGLLEALETLSMSHSMRSRFPNIPAFRPEFYDEIQQDRSNWSPELKGFIAQIADISITQNIAHVACAKALYAMSDENSTKASVKQEMDQHVGNVKQLYANQADKDIKRMQILILIDENGKRIPLNKASLAANTKLSGEQKEFLLTAWHQGTFDGGWHDENSREALKKSEKQEEFMSAGAPSRAELVVDLRGNKVRAYNLTQVQGINVSEGTSKLLTEAAVEVDITELNGESFIPGAASGTPHLRFQISNLASEMPSDLDIPTELRGEVPANGNFVDSLKDIASTEQLEKILHDKNIDEYGLKTACEAIKLRSGKSEFYHKLGQVQLTSSAANSDRLKEVMLNDAANATSGELTKIASAYNNIEKSVKARSDFQEKLLDIVIEQFAGQKIGDKEVSQLADRFVGVLEADPAKNPNGKITKANAERVIRYCASKSGAKMSFSQNWQSFKDKLSMIRLSVSKFIGMNPGKELEQQWEHIESKEAKRATEQMRVKATDARLGRNNLSRGSRGSRTL